MGNALYSFAEFARTARSAGQIIVQPRSGVADLEDMRSLLTAFRDDSSAAFVAGTITIDAKTRQGLIEDATEALRRGEALNGFPLLSHRLADVCSLAAEQGERFTIQIRHGTPDPRHLYSRVIGGGFSATEGGPVSYALPYGRVPLRDTLRYWREALRCLANAAERRGIEVHHETFGGCMMGQACPPDLLIALSVLECAYFFQLGIPSVSASLALGTCDEQDEGALLALNDICEERFFERDWHIVAYHFMGQFPKTEAGSYALIENGSRIAARGGAHRLIVKTKAEAHGIPTLADNLEALDRSAAAAASAAEEATERPAAVGVWRNMIRSNAERLIAATLSLDPDVGRALGKAFEQGLLDVPFCTHQDNRNQSLSVLDESTGAIRWATTGSMPIEADAPASQGSLTAERFHTMLGFNQRRFDAAEEE
tara:strand:- start:258575 stop:259855 length:1281 start_codon:yes stop_codon:yes gene_type:complete